MEWPPSRATGIFLGVLVTVTRPPSMVTTLLETRQSEERAGKCRANLEERARGHTTTGRRSDSDGTSRQSVTKQSRKSQSWRRHGALARCCGRSSLARGDKIGRASCRERV